MKSLIKLNALKRLPPSSREEALELLGCSDADVAISELIKAIEADEIPLKDGETLSLYGKAFGVNLISFRYRGEIIFKRGQVLQSEKMKEQIYCLFAHAGGFSDMSQQDHVDTSGAHVRAMLRYISRGDVGFPLKCIGMLYQATDDKFKAYFAKKLADRVAQVRTTGTEISSSILTMLEEKVGVHGGVFRERIREIGTC